jgi:hypothetical protein
MFALQQKESTSPEAITASAVTATSDALPHKLMKIALPVELPSSQEGAGSAGVEMKLLVTVPITDPTTQLTWHDSSELLATK